MNTQLEMSADDDEEKDDREICMNCRWWSQRDPDKGEREPWIGWCRRYPPVFVGVGDKEDDDADWRQPEVQDDDFCGEFTPRPTTVQPGPRTA